MDRDLWRGSLGTELNRYINVLGTTKFGFTTDLLYLLFLRHVSAFTQLIKKIFTKHDIVRTAAVDLFYVLST
jgi:hypothetical protein